MNSKVSQMTSDLVGVARVFGAGTALRWAGKILFNFPEILRSGNLSSADIEMGPGPFRVKHKAATALLNSHDAFSGAREIWVRDVYGLNGALKISEGDVVVDLGSNVGNFSMLALAAARTSRVIAVEALEAFVAGIRHQAELNGAMDRLTVCHAFIGVETDKQTKLRDKMKSLAPMITEQEFLKRHAIERIDFLKCDIEGSEFAFLEPESRILDITRQLAIELHGWGGDMHEFIATLERKGFRILSIKWASNDCVLLAARP